MFDWKNNDIYHAIRGGGSYRNKERLHVSQTSRLENSIITFCLTSHYDEKHTKDVIEMIRKLSPKVRGLRLIVCATTELAWLANGITDGMINVKPSIGLSSSAGKLIVKEAGGKETNLKGKAREEKDTLLITNGAIHDEILKILN